MRYWFPNPLAKHHPPRLGRWNLHWLRSERSWHLCAESDKMLIDELEGSLQIVTEGYQTGTPPIKSGCKLQYFTDWRLCEGDFPYSPWFQWRPGVYKSRVDIKQLWRSIGWSAWSQYYVWAMEPTYPDWKGCGKSNTFGTWSNIQDSLCMVSRARTYFPDLPFGFTGSPWPLHTAKVDWSPQFVLQTVGSAADQRGRYNCTYRPLYKWNIMEYICWCV